MEKVEELKSKMMEEQIKAMEIEIRLQELGQELQDKMKSLNKEYETKMKPLNDEYKALCDKIISRRDKIKQLVYGGSK